MKKIIIILFVIASIAKQSQAQDKHLIDSLTTKLKSLESEKKELRNNVARINDTTIADYLYYLSKAYWSNNAVQAMDYAEQCLTLSQQISYKKGIANAYNSMGAINDDKGDYLLSLEFYKKALKIYIEIGYKKGIAFSYNNIGIIYDEQGNYPEALKNHFASLKIREEIGDKKGIAASYSNIGIIYKEQGNYTEAMKNQLASLKIREEMGDKNGIAGCFNSIGIIYKEQGNYAEAMKNELASLKINEEIGDRRSIASSYNIIGIIYKEQGNYSEAMKNELASVKISEEIGDKNGIAESFANMGTIYFKEKKYKEASEYLNKAYSTADAIKALDQQKTIAKYLSDCYKKLNDWELAFHWNERYIQLKDSVYSEENKHKIEALEKNRAEDLKESKIQLDKLQLEKTKNERNYYLIGLGLLLIIVFFLIRNISISQKYSEANMFIKAFEQIKLFSTLPDDAPEVSLRKMSIIIISLSTTVAAVVWAWMYYIFFGICLPFYGPVIYFCILIPSIIVFFVIRKEVFLVNIQLFCIFFCPLMMEWTGGGLQYGVALTWSLLAPVGALIFKDIKNALFWMLLFIIVVFITIYFNDFFQVYKLSASETGESVLFGMNIIGPAIVIFFSMRYFVKTIFKDRKLLQETNGALTVTLDDLKIEKEKTESLLLNILPSEVAEELKTTGTAKAKNFDMVTVLFTDFKNFTQASEKLNAEELVAEINYIYSAFDKIITKHNIEKIKTIGDSYMCAGGLPSANISNPSECVKAALEINSFIKDLKQQKQKENKPYFEIRIGLHTGPVVAGIVGIKKFAYDIWGDTVNIASRMESSGEAGKVNISGATYELVKNDFKCTHRGKIQAKNKGEVDMYFVEG